MTEPAPVGKVGGRGATVASHSQMGASLRADAAEIYEKHADELIRFATVLVGPSGAEDVLASAMERVLGTVDWSTVNARRAYLFRAALNEARSQHRSTQRRLRREARTVPIDRETSPIVRPEVLDAMRRLTVRQRAVVYFTYWLDLDIANVARALQISPRTAERELAAARRHLEVLLR